MLDSIYIVGFPQKHFPKRFKPLNPKSTSSNNITISKIYTVYTLKIKYGFYFYKLNVRNLPNTKKLILLK